MAPWSVASACLGIACLLGAFAPAAGAKTRPATLSLGKVQLSASHQGRASLLVPVHYPIAFLGRRGELSISVLGTAGGGSHHWVLRPRLVGGPAHPPPERRRVFTFVQRIDLGRKLTAELRRGFQARLSARASFDLDGDGKPELATSDSAVQNLPMGSRKQGHICASVPLLQVKPGRQVAVKLPACDSPRRWAIDSPPKHGSARIRGDRLIFRAAKRRGSEQLTLLGSPLGNGAAGPGVRLGAPVSIKVGTAAGAVVRAMGDSVTAGFGYFDSGKPMPFEDLLECKPGAIYNDACSSNSVITSNTAPAVKFAADYGLANNISWAAQWANAHGIANFKNLAISGSEPIDWAPGGRLYAATRQIESEDPDYVLMTIGANPLLSEMLFGRDNMGCAIWSDFFGRYDECIEEAFKKVELRSRLASLYNELLARTDATIYLMQYPVTIPSSALLYSATQIAEMGRLLDREIASVSSGFGSPRLQAVAPPHFNVGVDISPVYPSRYSCSRFGFKVDGPSVQTELTQDELEGHFLSFCAGPVPAGPEWVISGDSGIHPSATGYTQMAGQVPAPK